jgi:hypothetical protein
MLGIAVAVLVGVSAVSVAVAGIGPPQAFDDPSLFGASQTVAHPTEGNQVQIGNAVDGEGDTAIAGGVAAPGTAHAVVFRRSGSLWSVEATLGASDDASIGYDVALSGETAIVGAPWRGPNSTGAAYVFTRSGTTWTETAILPGGGEIEYAGLSVDVEGDAAIVGAPAYDTMTGLARVYHTGRDPHGRRSRR